MNLERKSQMKYRVWCVVNVPSVAIHIPISNPSAAAKMIIQMAEWQLKNPDIDSNVFGLEEYVSEVDGTGTWMEWESVEGDSIDDLINRSQK